MCLDRRGRDKCDRGRVFQGEEAAGASQELVPGASEEGKGAIVAGAQ